QGQLEAAEEQFKAAADRETDDLLVHAGRVALYEQAGRQAELANQLSTLATQLKSKQAQAGLYRRRARIPAEVLGDVQAAKESYEKALELHPDDSLTLHQLARLCGEQGDLVRAVELRERAAALSEPARAAVLLCEVGEICEERLADEQGALRAY